MNDDETTDAKAVGGPGSPSTKESPEPASADAGGAVGGDEAEPKPQAEIATEAAEAPSVRSQPRPMWQRVALLLLPPVLVAAAMWVHWELNVPDQIRESPHDQGSKKRRSAKDKKKRDKDRAARARRSRKQRDEPRSQDELDRDWKRFGAVPFDDEPTRADWARRHQAIINRAVVVARREAFDGAPERPGVVLVDTTCRTVRCRLLLRSPNIHELDMVGDVLARLTTAPGPEGEPVWRSYEVEPAEAPTDAAEPSPEHYVQITVTFNTDETNTRGLTIPAEEGADEEGADEEGDAPSDPPTAVGGA